MQPRQVSRERLINKDVHQHAVLSQIRTRIPPFVTSPRPSCDKFWTCVFTQYYLRLFSETSCSNLRRSSESNDRWRRRRKPAAVGYFASCIRPYGLPKFWSSYCFHSMHLILCRIIPLVIFAALLLTSSNFPVQFHCHWPIQTTSASHANFSQSQTTNHSVVDCSFPMGSKNEKLVSTVITVNILFGTMTFMELAYLLWSTWKDRSLCTDLEFCCVYLLRKRTRIRKLIKKIREKIPDDFFRLHDDFGEKRLSRRKLEDIYVNVVIQRGRAWTSRRKFKNRHETYEAHFKAPADATIPSR